MKKKTNKIALFSITLSLMAMSYFGASETPSPNSSLNNIFNISAAQASESGSSDYQGSGYCTAWKIGLKCLDSGTEACHTDC